MTDFSANNPQGGEAVPGELATNNISTDNTPIENETPETDNLEPEIDEVEYEGKKYNIPKPLKDAVLRQADYTRKTQDLAKEKEETQRALADEKKAISEQARVHQDDLKAVGEIYSLQKTISEYEKVNWQDLYARATTVQELAQIRGLEAEYHKTKDALAKAAGEFQQKRTQRELDSQRESAKLIEQAHAAVAKDIKEWSPEYFNKLVDFGTKELGYKAEEAKGVSDPRALKTLRLAFIGAQALKKEAAAARAAAAESAQPLREVGSKAGASQRRASDPSGDKLSDNEWTKRRREELQKRK